jgi:hypothetical protein
VGRHILVRPELLEGTSREQHRAALKADRAVHGVGVAVASIARHLRGVCVRRSCEPLDVARRAHGHAVAAARQSIAGVREDVGPPARRAHHAIVPVTVTDVHQGASGPRDHGRRATMVDEPIITPTAVDRVFPGARRGYRDRRRAPVAPVRTGRKREPPAANAPYPRRRERLRHNIPSQAGAASNPCGVGLDDRHRLTATSRCCRSAVDRRPRLAVDVAG